jgi:cytochrome c oxidase subunit 3
MGLRVLIASLAPLFIATMFCGWYFRDTGVGSTTEALPALPLLLLLSTAILAALSYSAEKGTFAGLKASLVLGFAFLISQSFVWSDLIKAETGAGVHPMYAFNFYLMTALHAAHVVGGLVYSIVSLQSFKKDGEEMQQRVRNHAVYWHFLGATWIGILLNLLAIRVPNPEESFLAPLSAAVCLVLLVIVLVYQAIAIKMLWRRGERVFAAFSLLLPVAFLHIWARGEELDTQKMALRWGIAQALLLVAMMFAGTLHLGRFASSYVEIQYK